MGKVGQMVLEIQKEWMKQLNEKNEIIKDLEERLEIGGESNKALSDLCDDLLREKRELSEIIARHIDRNDSGDLHIRSIWEDVDPYEFHKILKYLDIPLSEKEIKENEN